MFFKRLFLFLSFFFTLFSWSPQHDVGSSPFLTFDEETMRMRFMAHAPKDFRDMIDLPQLNYGQLVEKQAFVDTSGLQKQDYYETRRSDYEWSNGDGTVNFGIDVKTGDPVKDVLLPKEARAVFAAIQFVRETAKYVSGLNLRQKLGIKPKMTSSSAHYIIQQDPYLELIFRRINEIIICLQNINCSHDVIARIVARAKLLEYELPPPYDKKFKIAQDIFRRECTDEYGDLLPVDQDINVKKIFKKFLNQHYEDARQFIKQIPKLKDYKDYKPRKGPRSYLHEDIVEAVNKDHQMTLPRLRAFCKKHGQQVMRDLYKALVQRRVNNRADKINQDPLKRAYPGNNSLEMNEQLLIRSHYQAELQDWISGSTIETVEARDKTYQALGDAGMYDSLPEGYHFTVLDNFIENTCKGIDVVPEKVAAVFFDESGVLKKYSHHPYVRTHIAQHRLTSPKLQKAVNYALAIQDKKDGYKLHAACEEILHQAVFSLHSLDEDFGKVHEEEAYRLYRLLADNKSADLYERNLDPDKIGAFMTLNDLVDIGETERLDAYKKAKKNNFILYEKKHELTPKVKGFMQAYQLNPYLFSTMYGNDFQHYFNR